MNGPAMLAAVAQVVVGMWFLSAAVAKLMDLTAARRVASEYSLVPLRFALYGVPAAVAVEAAIAGGLLGGIAVIPASALAILVLLGYAGLMGVDLVRGLRHDCGCGRSRVEISWALVVRNATAALVLGLAAGVAAPVGPTDRILMSLSVVAIWLLGRELDRALRLVREVRSGG